MKKKIVYAVFFSMLFSPPILAGVLIMMFGMPTWMSTIAFMVILIGNVVFMQNLFEKLENKNYKGFLSDIEL